LNERLGWADPILAHHAAIPLFGALGVLVAGLFAGQSRRLLPALFAAATLALFPLYWNHAHNNVKDVPAAALFVATLWAAWRAFGRRPAANWGWAAAAGLLWGLGLGTKANALVIPPILLAWGAWMWLWPRLRGRPRIDHECTKGMRLVPPFVHSWPQFVVGLGLMLAVGAVVLVAVWPYLWPDPPRRLWSMLRYFSSVGQGYPVYFEGQLYLAGQTVPWRYALTHLVLTTPLATLALAGLGLLRAIRAAWRGVSPMPKSEEFASSGANGPAGAARSASEDASLLMVGSGMDWRGVSPMPKSEEFASSDANGPAGAARSASEDASLLMVGRTWRSEDSAAVLVLVALGATLVRASLPGMVIYNGLRQIMEVVLLLCILAGFGAEWLWDALSARLVRRSAPACTPAQLSTNGARINESPAASAHSFIRGRIRGWPRTIIGAALIALLLLPQLATLARLHPYEGAFFNALAGGMARAGERYAPEYWGQSYKEGATWLNEHAGQGAWVAVPIAGHIARYSLRPDLRLVVTNQVADLAAWTGEGYVMFMRDRDWYAGRATLPAFCEQEGAPVHTLQAGKATILSIYRWPLTS